MGTYIYSSPSPLTGWDSLLEYINQISFDDPQFEIAQNILNNPDISYQEALEKLGLANFEPRIENPYFRANSQSAFTELMNAFNNQIRIEPESFYHLWDQLNEVDQSRILSTFLNEFSQNVESPWVPDEVEQKPSENIFIQRRIEFITQTQHLIEVLEENWNLNPERAKFLNQALEKIKLNILQDPTLNLCEVMKPYVQEVNEHIKSETKYSWVVPVELPSDVQSELELNSLRIQLMRFAHQNDETTWLESLAFTALKNDYIKCYKENFDRIDEETLLSLYKYAENAVDQEMLNLKVSIPEEQKEYMRAEWVNEVFQNEILHYVSKTYFRPDIDLAQAQDLKREVFQVLENCLPSQKPIDDLLIETAMMTASFGFAAICREIVFVGARSLVVGAKESSLAMRTILGRAEYLAGRSLYTGIYTSVTLGESAEFLLARSIEAFVSEMAQSGFEGEWLFDAPDWQQRVVLSAASLGFFSLEARVLRPLLLHADILKVLPDGPFRNLVQNVFLQGNIDAGLCLMMGAIQNGAITVSDLDVLFTLHPEMVYEAFVMSLAMRGGLPFFQNRVRQNLSYIVKLPEEALENLKNNPKQSFYISQVGSFRYANGRFIFEDTNTTGSKITLRQNTDILYTRFVTICFTEKAFQQEKANFQNNRNPVIIETLLKKYFQPYGSHFMVYTQDGQPKFVVNNSEGIQFHYKAEPLPQTQFLYSFNPKNIKLPPIAILLNGQFYTLAELLKSNQELQIQALQAIMFNSK